MLPSPTRSSRLHAPCPRASSRFTPRTFIGDSAMFSSTERCGNRLKLWNTKPIRLRIRFSSRPLLDGAWMSTPSTVQRARLDLLEPVDRPDQRRLAGAGRAADDDHLALLDLGVDVGKRVVSAVPLVHVREHDHSNSSPVGSGRSSSARAVLTAAGWSARAAGARDALLEPVRQPRSSVKQTTK